MDSKPTSRPQNTGCDVAPIKDWSFDGEYGMAPEKLIEIIDRYERYLTVLPRSPELQHVRTMLPKMRVLLEEGRREKLMRWLGFIQGVLWSERIYTLDELKNHNKP